MQSIDLIASSNSSHGATDVSTDGSQFSAQYSPGFTLKGDKIANVQMKIATLWFTDPNIETGVNDKIYFTIDSTDYTITFDQGLYSFSSFTTELANLLTNVSAAVSSDAFTLTASTSTQKVIINFNTADLSIDFTQDDTVRDILGFDSAVVASAINTTVKADNIANFNQLDYFLIHCDLVSSGITVNGKKSQILARVPIPTGTSVGSQIVYEPLNPSIITENTLLNQKISNIKFWLTDQDNNPINTLGETWSITFSIEWS